MTRVIGLAIFLLSISCSYSDSFKGASNQIQFAIGLNEYEQQREVTVFVDEKEYCKLTAEKNFMSFFSNQSKCKFKITDKVHYYTIVGSTEFVDESEMIQGKGQGVGVILDVIDEYQQLRDAKTITQLFSVYQSMIASLNASLKPADQIKNLIVNQKETKESIKTYQQVTGLGLPNDYIQMISQFGYPEGFVPLSSQKSIANIYIDDLSYSKDQFNYHEGIEDNKVFYTPDDIVFHYFRDNTKAVCDGQPMIDSTNIDEYGYYEVDPTKIDTSFHCDLFFDLMQETLLERFVEDLRSGYGYNALLVLEQGTHEAFVDSEYNDTIEYRLYYE